MRIAAKLIIYLTLSLGIHSAFAQKAKVDSTAPKKVIKDTAAVIEEEFETPIAGVLNAQETRSYRSDFLPINLTQRGRQATSAYLGMPPGFFQFKYAGNPLSNPVTGFWNEQWIPIYQIAREFSPFGSMQEAYLPPLPYSSKPITRIIFSQDYTTNLSFVDINFIQRLSPKNFIQLSGANFLGDGSEGLDYSKFKLNTYRGQLHWQWGQKWSTDLFYWGIDHDFNMVAEEDNTTDRFEQNGDIFWILARGRLSEKDSLVFVPGYMTVGDRYKRTIGELRNNRYRIAYGDIKYIRNFSAGALGTELNGRFITNKGDRYWAQRKETDGKALAFVHLKNAGFNLRLEGGAYLQSEAGGAPMGSVTIDKRHGSRSEFGAVAFSKPQSIPIYWRTFYHDSIPRYPEDHLIHYRGVQLFFKSALMNSLWLRAEPFFLRAEGYPVFLQETMQWQKTTFENYGIRVLAGWNFWKIQVQNDFTYNHNYKEAFAQQVNNITSVKISLPLLNNAFRLDGVFNWRYVGYFKLINFQRLLNQYWISDQETGPYYIGNFRIQGQFRDAIVFFIWENLLSEDYFFVPNTLESLRIFRLGIDWVLFD
jgi:hypothetical protein